MKNSPIPSIYDVQLTEHFRLSELLKSATAERLNILNIPRMDTVERLMSLCIWLLEPLRIQYGEPIYITSGYRSEALNKAIKGAKGSQHMKGEAADIKGENRDENMKIYRLLVENYDFDQLILEKCDEQGRPAWLHVSYRNFKENRQQILRT